jgi:hypothetical protein
MSQNVNLNLRTLHVVVERDLKERILVAATAEDRPISYWLRAAIREKLERDSR